MQSVHFVEQNVEQGKQKPHKNTGERISHSKFAQERGVKKKSKKNRPFHIVKNDLKHDIYIQYKSFR